MAGKREARKRTRWPNRLEKQLHDYRTETLKQTKADIARDLKGDPYSLGITLMGATPVVACQGELALLAGKAKKGWGLLAAAHKLRAYSALLHRSYTSTSAYTLALFEALQWNELTTAKTLGKQLQKALLGHWDQRQAAPPSESEGEALAFHLLALRVPRAKCAKRVLDMLVDVADFAGAAGLASMESDAAFETAFYSFWDWCDDEAGLVPRGARLSAAPVFACLRVRKETKRLSAEQCDKALSVAPQPFASFLQYADAPVDTSLATVVAQARAVVIAQGYDVD